MPYVDMCTSMLCCFHNLTSTQNPLGVLTASVDRCTEIKSPFSGITSSGSVEEGVRKRGMECVNILTVVKWIDALAQLSTDLLTAK